MGKLRESEDGTNIAPSPNGIPCGNFDGKVEGSAWSESSGIGKGVVLNNMYIVEFQ